MNVVIYARFSCKRQTEQSIEGQLKICYEYAAAHNYTVVGEYIDRAQSGTSDNRSDFQRMITDSEKHTKQHNQGQSKAHHAFHTPRTLLSNREFYAIIADALQFCNPFLIFITSLLPFFMVKCCL